MQIDSKYLVEHGFKSLIDHHLLNRFLNLDSGWQKVISVYGSGEGWGFGDSSFREAFPDHKLVGPKMLRLALAMPKAWKRFGCKQEMINLGGNWQYWIPDSETDLILAIGNILKSVMEEQVASVGWERSPEGFRVNLTGSSAHIYHGVGNPRSSALLGLVEDILDFGRRLKMPSFSELQGNINIVKDGYYGQPALIGDFVILKKFSSDHSAYIIHSKPRPGDIISERKFVCQMDLVEGRFYLLGNEPTHIFAVS